MAAVALAALLAGAGAAPAPADPLTVEKDGVVKVEKQLEAGPNGPATNDKGATVQGINGRNSFQDSDTAAGRAVVRR